MAADTKGFGEWSVRSRGRMAADNMRSGCPEVKPPRTNAVSRGRTWRGLVGDAAGEDRAESNASFGRTLFSRQDTRNLMISEHTFMNIYFNRKRRKRKKGKKKNSKQN